jgi:hypothetical protein
MGRWTTAPAATNLILTLEKTGTNKGADIAIVPGQIDTLARHGAQR